MEYTIIDEFYVQNTNLHEKLNILLIFYGF